ncbi:MAG: hypothetical protein ABDH37_08035, partial [Candidatus Hydrothermales bacterium]
ISRIKIKVNGANVELKENGKKLILSTPIGKIEDGEIKSFGKESLKEFETFYKKDKEGLIYLEVKNFYGKEDLIIDPPLALLWSTYYGG